MTLDLQRRLKRWLALMLLQPLAVPMTLDLQRRLKLCSRPGAAADFYIAGSNDIRSPKEIETKN